VLNLLAFGKWWRRWESFESVVKFAAENEMNPKARAADEVLGWYNCESMLDLLKTICPH
jgi:hypothetical protein